MIKRYKQNEINELANILKNDGVISVPTDTVYGVCARINSKKAHDKLMNIKVNEPGCVIQEVGYIIPYMNNNDMDPLSLSLSLTETEKSDERIAKSVNDMLEEYVW